MQAAIVERQRWRREYIERFLTEFGLVHERLANSTKKCLDDWARQVKVVEDQPSSNYGSVVIQLCKAVESELATGLAGIETLAFLRDGTLGQKAKRLETTKLDEPSKQRLTARGTKPGYVTSDLPRLLSRLARLRSDTDAAHGNAQINSASAVDAENARKLAGQILRGIAADVQRLK